MLLIEWSSKNLLICLCVIMILGQGSDELTLEFEVSSSSMGVHGSGGPI